MQSRTRTYLTFSLFCLLPALVIAAVSFFVNLTSVQTRLQDALQRDAEVLVVDFQTLQRERENELRNLAASDAIKNYIQAPRKGSDAATTDGEFKTVAPAVFGDEHIKDAIDPLFFRQTNGQARYTTILGFGSDRKLLFVAEAPTAAGIVIRSADPAASEIQPADSVWTKGATPTCAVATRPGLGSMLRCSVPVVVYEQTQGALVADIKLDSLIASLANTIESRWRNPDQPQPPTIVMVVDDAGAIVYHTYDALKYQPAHRAVPYFAPVARAAAFGDDAPGTYTSPEGDTWVSGAAPLVPGKLALTVASNYSLASRPARRLGWFTILSALVAGIGATIFLSRYYMRRTGSIDRVTEAVGAIAQGQYDQRIDLRSSDNLRPLVDNVGLMTQQLREQLAREAESRQFQSFVRLSAVLTHDLKNSIEALSLTVSNMERHFDNAQFRADAMKTLRDATENLRSLVTRLSNPVSTLSGEHKRPKRVDLVPLIRQVVSMTAAQSAEGHEIKFNLPEPLYALVDAERIEKVIENLIINALEAMAGKKGVLTIEGGETEQGKTFFSVTDTGEGMSRRFVEEKLFHPFATTKKRGVGLGLYTCREVVRANGGAIEVESERGAGTTFRVMLPSAEIFGGESKPQKQPLR